MKCMTHCSDSRSGKFGRCALFGLLAVAGIGAVTGVVMVLWNALLPEIFAGVSPITYWQALGLLVLSRLLFGGFRGGCHGRWHKRREQWEALSPEEREQFKSRFRSRWGMGCGSNMNHAENADTGAAATRNEPSERT